MKDVPPTDNQRNFKAYSKEEMAFARSAPMYPPAYAGKFMPKWYRAKYQSDYTIQYSSDEMVQLLLHAEPTEMIGKKTVLDTFSRVQGGTCHPAQLAELRAKRRGDEIRARIAAEARADPLRQTM